MGDCGVYALYLYEPDTEKLLEMLHHRGKRIQNRGHHAYGVYLPNREGKVFRAVGSIPPLDEFLGKVGEFYGKLLKKSHDRGVLHVRYATSGEGDLLKNSQPVAGRGVFATAHNGQVTNMAECSEQIRCCGLKLEGCGDGEIITRTLQMALESGDSLEGAVQEVYEKVKGGYSVVGVLGDRIFAFRDPYGTKPLFMGESDYGTAFSSGTQALDGKKVEVKPGELIIVDLRYPIKLTLAEPKERFCGFELSYFSAPQNYYKAVPVAEIRKRLGEELAKEYRKLLKRCDYIVPVPRSGLLAAEGMSEKSGKKQYHAIIDNRFSKARSFILDRGEREKAIEEGYSFVGDLKGKKIALVDDSIVRGTTIKALVGKIRELGAKEIHMFLSFPYLAHPCLHGGIDMANYSEFIVNKHRHGGKVDFEGLARELGVNSVNYISEGGFKRAAGSKKLCLACHNGRYPFREAQELSELARRKHSQGRLYELKISQGG